MLHRMLRRAGGGEFGLRLEPGDARLADRFVAALGLAKPWMTPLLASSPAADRTTSPLLTRNDTSRSKVLGPMVAYAAAILALTPGRSSRRTGSG